MTTKTANPQHVVVDGSNIATEGRSMPSLAQLNEAVNSYIADHPGVRVTVVVDATFGHRIAPSEVKEFDAAIANNELVAPPAGAVGRGDAFVLSIAKKAKATILSNDSFQEFHGDHEWLFDEGRLVGGKPVPHVGWVWVSRNPVRGPVSRKAVRTSKSSSDRAASTSASSPGGLRQPVARRASGRRASKEAMAPMPVPTSPPPGPAAPSVDVGSAASAPSPAGGQQGDVVNELMPFLDFVQHHPVGTSVNAIVDSYSSHGAYVRIGDVLGYVPLRLMSDPPPRSARDVMKIGDAVTLVVASFAPLRRSIDCAIPNMASVLQPQDGDAVVAEAAVGAVIPPPRATAKKAAATKGLPSTPEEATPKQVAKKAARPRPAKRAAAEPAVAVTTPATEAQAMVEQPGEKKKKAKKATGVATTAAKPKSVATAAEKKKKVGSRPATKPTAANGDDPPQATAARRRRSTAAGRAQASQPDPGSSPAGDGGPPAPPTSPPPARKRAAKKVADA